MVSDPVADALIRIKNGYLSHKGEVELNYSKLVSSICTVLQKEGFIDGIKEDKSAGITSKIVVTLKYESRKPVLTDVRRVSKPGLRVYRSKKSLPWVLNGLGIALISTPKGIMTDKQARKEGLGGEVMALVW